MIQQTSITGEQFSQSSLQTYLDCKQAYKLRYIDQLTWPSIQVDPQLENEKQQAEGIFFHKLIHQYLLGIPQASIDSQVLNNPSSNIKDWWTNFIFAINSNTLDLSNYSHKFPEILLTQSFERSKLVAKYDLIAVREDKIHIFDWKTNTKKPDHLAFEKKIQTILYMEVLAKSGFANRFIKNFQLSDIQMTYWFSNFPNQSNIISYGEDKHRAAIAEISSLIREIEADTLYPKTDNLRRCAGCVYRSYCSRGIKAGFEADLTEEEWNDQYPAFEEDDLFSDF